MFGESVTGAECRRGKGKLMGDPTSEVVSVGVSSARIVGVSRERIGYIDSAGDERFIDLDDCARNWVRWREGSSRFRPLPGSTPEGIAVWNSRCVGQRDASDSPPWPQFMNERCTRFVFTTDKALYKELSDPLKRAGWHTFDTS
jgi:hypothetical protein